MNKLKAIFINEIQQVQASMQNKLNACIHNNSTCPQTHRPSEPHDAGTNRPNLMDLILLLR